MKTKQHLAIFDIDGTLLHSEAVHQKAFVRALQLMGVKQVDTDWARYTL